MLSVSIYYVLLMQFHINFIIPCPDPESETLPVISRIINICSNLLDL